MAGESIDLFSSIIGNPDMMANEIASIYTQWWTARASYRQRYAEVLEYLEATDTRTTSNDANGHGHNTHRPKLTHIYDNLKSNYSQGIMPNSRWFQFDGEDNQGVSQDVKDTIEAYLRTKHRLSKFRKAANEIINDWILGECFAQVTYVNESHTDADSVVQPGYQGPRLVRIDPDAIVYNIHAKSFASSPKIIRTVKTLGEAARDIEEQPELAYQREVWDKVISNRQQFADIGAEDIQAGAQALLSGFGDYATYIKGNQIEFLEFYGDFYDVDNNKLYKNHVITVVDRMYVIRQQPVDTWNGRPMIFHGRYRKRANNLVGMGALENLVGMQYYINHLENAKADAFDDMLIPDRVIIGDVNEEITGEKGEVTYYVALGGDVKNLAPETTVLNADFKIREIEDKMELYAGAPSQAVGVRSPGEKTKFEIATLENNRSRFYQFNLQEFESDVMEEIINAEVQLARKYLASSTDTIRLEDPTTGAKIFQKIRAQDITANGKLVPKGARHFIRQSQLTQNLVQLEQIILAADPEIRQHFPSVKMARLLEELLEFEEFSLVQEYGRIPEQLKATQLQNAAQSQVQQESLVPLEDTETTTGVG